MIHALTTWDRRFLAMAAHVATWSKDPSTQCGAIIADPSHRIISQGYNGFPAGVIDSKERLHDRDVKLRMTIHAEMNALLHARQSLSGCTIYVHPMPPCAQCAAAIIQSGIRRIVATSPTEAQRNRWGSDLELASAMYDEAGVWLILMDLSTP